MALAAHFIVGPPAPGQEPAPPPLTAAAVEVRGLGLLEPPVRLPARLPLEPGDPYTAERLAALERVVAAAFAERGRPYAVIEIAADVDEPTRTARVLVEVVDAGPAVVFGEIRIEAEAPLRELDVLERLAFRPGDPFRPSPLAESVIRLRELPIVDDAGILPVGLELGETTVETHVVVTTRRRTGVWIDGSLSSVRCLEAMTFFQDRYFLGRPAVFTLSAGLSNIFAAQLGDRFPCAGAGEEEFAQLDHSVAGDLILPRRGDPRTTYLIRGFVHRESSPQAYVHRGFGARLAVARDLGGGVLGMGGYAPERNTLRRADLYFCANFGQCEPGELAPLTRARWASPVEASVRWTPWGPVEGVGLRRARERDIAGAPWPPLDPWRWWSRAGLAVAGRLTGSQWSYLRGVGEGGLTRVLADRLELAGRTRLGLLAAERVHPPAIRFYSGGTATFRGRQQNELGPLVLFARPADLDALGCAPVPGGCPSEVLAEPVDAGLVQPRPMGGDLVAESGIEFRIWAADRVQFAAFVDHATLWRDAIGSPPVPVPGLAASETVIAPGVGLRVLTRLGPIRVDAGYDPTGDRTMPLFTRDPDGDLVVLGTAVYNPYTYDDPGTLREFFRRLQIHLAVGQPF